MIAQLTWLNLLVGGVGDMDTATTLQLACGLVQLIGFALRTVRELQQVYNSPSSMNAGIERMDSQRVLLMQHASRLTFYWDDVEMSSTGLRPAQ